MPPPAIGVRVAPNSVRSQSPTIPNRPVSVPPPPQQPQAQPQPEYYPPQQQGGQPQPQQPYYQQQPQAQYTHPQQQPVYPQQPNYQQQPAPQQQQQQSGAPGVPTNRPPSPFVRQNSATNQPPAVAAGPPQPPQQKPPTQQQQQYYPAAQQYPQQAPPQAQPPTPMSGSVMNDATRPPPPAQPQRSLSSNGSVPARPPPPAKRPSDNAGGNMVMMDTSVNAPFPEQQQQQQVAPPPPAQPPSRPATPSKRPLTVPGAAGNNNGAPQPPQQRTAPPPVQNSNPNPNAYIDISRTNLATPSQQQQQQFGNNGGMAYSDPAFLEADAKQQLQQRKNAIELVDEVCPFGLSEHKVQVLYEVFGGINYAEIERLKAARSSIPRLMAALARKEVFEEISASLSAGLSNGAPNRLTLGDVWVQMRPGQIQSVFLNFDGQNNNNSSSSSSVGAGGSAISLLDAEWPIRIYVAVRCDYEDANDIAVALQCFAEEADAFSQVVRVYQQHVKRLITAQVAVVDMNEPFTTSGIRDCGARGRMSLTTVLPSANNGPASGNSPSTYNYHNNGRSTPRRSISPVRTLRSASVNNNYTNNNARAIADEPDGRIYMQQSSAGGNGIVSYNNSYGGSATEMNSGNPQHGFRQPTPTRGSVPNSAMRGGGGGRQGGGEEYFLKVSEVPRYGPAYGY